MFAVRNRQQRLGTICLITKDKHYFQATAGSGSANTCYFNTVPSTRNGLLLHSFRENNAARDGRDRPAHREFVWSAVRTCSRRPATVVFGLLQNTGTSRSQCTGKFACVRAFLFLLLDTLFIGGGGRAAIISKIRTIQNRMHLRFRTLHSSVLTACLI